MVSQEPPVTVGQTGNRASGVYLDAKDLLDPPGPKETEERTDSLDHPETTDPLDSLDQPVSYVKRYVATFKSNKEKCQ